MTADEPLRLLNVVPTYLPAVRYGGPIRSVHELCRELAAAGHDVHVFTTNVDGPFDSDVPLMRPVDLDGVKVTYFPSRTLRRLYWSPPMRQALESAITGFDVVHLHAVYLWPILAGARAARAHGVPYVMSPRGMLVPELIRRKSRWVKEAWIRLVERANLEAAAAIHTTSAVEARHLVGFGWRLPPVMTIPHGVDDPPPASAMALSPDVLAALADGPMVLAFGRISWEKGLDRLIAALADAPSVRIVIAGDDASGLAAACLELVRKPEWARSMAERARRVAADRFSHRRSGAALVGTYHAVTHRPRLAGPGLSPWVAALARGTRRSVAAALGSSARRRMESGRREPALLKEALRSARQILVVCHGNIIRSPFAERLLAQKLEEGSPLRIVSRGLGARPGTPSPAPATLAAAGFQVDLTTHVALPVSVGDVAASDVIFVMDVAQLREMQRRYRASRGKTFLLTSLAPDWPLEVRDPFAQHDSVFQASYEHIAASVAPIARLLPGRGVAE